MNPETAMLGADELSFCVAVATPPGGKLLARVAILGSHEFVTHSVEFQNAVPVIERALLKGGFGETFFMAETLLCGMCDTRHPALVLYGEFRREDAACDVFGVLVDATMRVAEIGDDDDLWLNVTHRISSGENSHHEQHLNALAGIMGEVIQR